MDTGDYEQFRQWIHKAAESLQIRLEDNQVERMYEHLAMVLPANEDFNLTRITDPAEAAVRLVGDSLAVLPWVARRLETQHSGLGTQHCRVLDMGTGAGYPSIPLAICRPDWTVTAIDTVGKKVRFLAQAAAQLGLGNFLPEQIQAREWHGKVAPFDLVVTRALGDLSVVVREGARFLKPNGYLVSYHAEHLTPEEEKTAGRMLDRYKLHQVDSFEYTLTSPAGAITRRLIIIAKRAPS